MFWIWDLDNHIFLLKDDEINPLVLKLSSERHFLFVGSDNGTVKCYSLKDGHSIWSSDLSEIIGTPVCIETFFDSKTEFMAIGSRTGEICLVNCLSGEIIKTLKFHEDYISDLIIVDSILISSSFDGLIVVWDLKLEDKIAVLDGHIHRIVAMKMTGNLQHLISYDRAGRLLSWQADWLNLTHTSAGRRV